MNQITIAFSTHRPEVLDHAAVLMQQHDSIVLEEPPTQGFYRMLDGKMAIDEYVMQTDTEFPEFTRRTCGLLRDLNRQGKQILQIEPFLEVLLGIHEFFAAGGHFREFDTGSIQYLVYRAERDATGCLLKYYQSVVQGSFDATIAAVKQFARADAARFLLRDQMRAGALIPLLSTISSVYIEAGEMHPALLVELRKKLPHHLRLRSLNLMSPIVKSLTGKRRLPAPGDLLTLGYIFQPDRNRPREDLLAARSLIYNKIIEKQEMSEKVGSYPHTRNEIETIRTVQLLSLKDCKILYSEIRLAPSEDARAIVDAYRAERGTRLGFTF